MRRGLEVETSELVPAPSPAPSPLPPPPTRRSAEGPRRPAEAAGSAPRSERRSQAGLGPPQAVARHEGWDPKGPAGGWGAREVGARGGAQLQGAAWLGACSVAGPASPPTTAPHPHDAVPHAAWLGPDAFAQFQRRRSHAVRVPVSRGFGGAIGPHDFMGHIIVMVAPQFGSTRLSGALPQFNLCLSLISYHGTRLGKHQVWCVLAARARRSLVLLAYSGVHGDGYSAQASFELVRSSAMVRLWRPS